MHYKKRRPLSVTHPAICKYWLYKKNCGFGPEDFSYGSEVMVWWVCPKEKIHTYQVSICDRVKRFEKGNSSCAYCCSFKPSVTNSLASKYPKLAKEWVQGLNERTPDQVPSGSHLQAWWQCKVGHVWRTEVRSRTEGYGCPQCFGTSTDLRDYPKVLKQFDRTKNPGIDPYKLPTQRRIWWKCPKSTHHAWYSTFTRQVYSGGERCPFCRGIRASQTNNLTLDKRLVKEFHPTKNEGLSPEQITLGTATKIWWQCKKGPDHEWQVSVKDRRHYKSGCPFCANKRLSVTNSLSNVAPDVAGQWHPKKNGKVTPAMVIATSMKKYWFVCDNGHEYQTRPLYKVNYKKGCGACYRQRGKRKKQ
jgi:hypothetical protein